jgi:hypothetical protein
MTAFDRAVYAAAYNEPASIRAASAMVPDLRAGYG